MTSSFSLKIHLASSLLVAFLVGIFPSPAAADEITEKKQAQIESCEAIPNSDASTWLIFNPSDMQTMNHRSRCFQSLAIAERDVSLCQRVVEKKSFFLDGSGISPERCRERVARRKAKDRQEFMQKDFTELHRLTTLTFQRNGNGRDFDLIIETVGEMAGKYQLIVYLTFPNGRQITVLDDKTSYGTNTSKRYLLLRAAELSQKLYDPDLQKNYPGLARLFWVRDEGNRFIYDRVPEEVVQSSIPIQINFSSLPAWQPEPAPLR